MREVTLPQTDVVVGGGGEWIPYTVPYLHLKPNRTRVELVERRPNDSFPSFLLINFRGEECDLFYVITEIFCKETKSKVYVNLQLMETTKGRV